MLPTVSPANLPTSAPQCPDECVDNFIREIDNCEGLRRFQDRTVCISTAEKRKEECVDEGFDGCRPTSAPTQDPAQCLHKCVDNYKREKDNCEGLPPFQDRKVCISTAKKRKKECVHEGYARCKNVYKTDSLDCFGLPVLQGRRLCKIRARKKRYECIKEFEFSKCNERLSKHKHFIGP